MTELLFDLRPPTPRGDAAPPGSGAHVNSAIGAAELINLPLTAPARRNAPGTSRTAADRIGIAAKALRAKVLDYIVERGNAGATDDEGEAVLGIKSQTYTPRRGELVKLGLVIDSGARRPTTSGRAAVVWVASASSRWGGER